MLHCFILFNILSMRVGVCYYYEDLPSSKRPFEHRCQLLTALIKESVRSVKSFMTTERTNSKINNVTLLVISSESNFVAGSAKRRYSTNSSRGESSRFSPANKLKNI